MDTFIGLFQGLPGVLFVSLIFGSIAVIRIYFLIAPDIRRFSLQDRRQSKVLVNFPMTDHNNKTVAADRRCYIDRRIASYVTTNNSASLLLIKDH